MYCWRLRCRQWPCPNSLPQEWPRPRTSQSLTAEGRFDIQTAPGRIHRSQPPHRKSYTSEQAQLQLRQVPSQSRHWPQRFSRNSHLRQNSRCLGSKFASPTCSRRFQASHWFRLAIRLRSPAWLVPLGCAQADRRCCS